MYSFYDDGNARLPFSLSLSLSLLLFGLSSYPCYVACGTYSRAAHIIRLTPFNLRRPIAIVQSWPKKLPRSHDIVIYNGEGFRRAKDLVNPLEPGLRHELGDYIDLRRELIGTTDITPILREKFGGWSWSCILYSTSSWREGGLCLVRCYLLFVSSLWKNQFFTSCTSRSL